MKLFHYRPTISQEELNNLTIDYFLTNDYIAQEAFSDFLYKIKDKINNFKIILTREINDRATLDVINTKFEMLNRIKRLNFYLISNEITSKPENFKGYYVDYSLDLLKVAKELLPHVENTLNLLKTNISTFINEYEKSNLHTLTFGNYFTKTELFLETHRKAIAKYFPLSNGSSKARIKDILRSLNDIPALYDRIRELDNTLNLAKIEFINNLGKEISDLVDTLIEYNRKTRVFEENSEVKKSLINAIYITAKEIELLAYVYSNMVIFYGAFKHLMDDLKQLSDTHKSS